MMGRCRQLLAVILILAAAPIASAQPSLGGGAEAVKLGREALTLFDAGGRYDEAFEKFQSAEQIYHSPVFVLYMARCQRARGKWVEALALFKRVDQETLAPSAPPSWAQAQTDARRDLATLTSDAPSVMITVKRGGTTHGTTTGVVATLDRKPIAIDTRTPVDPGEHTVEVIDPTTDNHSEAKTIKCEPKTETQIVSFTLPAASPPGSPTSGVDAQPRLPPTVSSKSSGPYLPGVYAIGGGALLSVAGGIVGAFALAQTNSARDSLPDSCAGTVCPESKRAEVEGKLDHARGLAITADALFITAGVAFAVGITLMIVKPGRSKSMPPPPLTAASHISF